MKDRLYKNKGLVKFLLDTLGWLGMTIIAFLLRLDGNLNGYVNEVILLTAVLTLPKIALIYLVGTHRQSWRNTTFQDIFALVKMVSLIAVPYFVVVISYGPELNIPYSIPLIEVVLSFMGFVTVRASARFILKYRVPISNGYKEKKRVLIVGAGESGTMVAKEMLKSSESNLHPVAFLDDDLGKRKQKFMGIPVVGTIFELPQIVKRLQIDEIIIAMPSESGNVIRRVVDKARGTNARYRIIPPFSDLLSGKVSISQLREVDVEDLLKRKPIQLSTDAIENYIKGKRILVTGAGGSIGSEIIRQISRFNPTQVTFLGRGENSIHQLVREINEYFPELDYSIRIADVRDYQSLRMIFQNDQPEVVFHAAAHKHVPLMEENPSQAILNNVIGTKNLIELALENDISHFVNISTDKAVNPTSIMGASKRIAEHIVEWGASMAKSNQIYVSVRFGNVLGSRGSVVPIFKDQIQKGGPITVTHPKMIRYFMTIPEASQLVLQAGALNNNGAVYVLDMGDPVNIEQMARDLVRLSGLEPDADIKIEYSGIREGEKLYEELLTAEEGTDVTQHEKIFMARKNSVLSDLELKIDNLHRVALEGDKLKIKNEIYKMVPSYSGAKLESET